MCRVCGSDKDTRECCPMSRPMSTEAFMRHVFPGGHSDPSGDRATYVPACTVRDFYEDYRMSGLPIARYVESISAEG